MIWKTLSKVSRSDQRVSGGKGWTFQELSRSLQHRCDVLSHGSDAVMSATPHGNILFFGQNSGIIILKPEHCHGISPMWWHHRVCDISTLCLGAGFPPSAMWTTMGKSLTNWGIPHSQLGNGIPTTQPPCWLFTSCWLLHHTMCCGIVSAS